MVLKREGLKINHKKVYRIYRAFGLKVLKRGRRKRAFGSRRVEGKSSAPNEQWALDFVLDALADGRRIRFLTIIDTYTRECLCISLETSINGRKVTKILNGLIGSNRRPKTILSDNGTEFTSNAGVRLSLV